ncbi:MAG TPA: hypothetical protein RMH99_31675 [Sandaracinaceae bacterium LLY-WYZ-13_1]|nr:hypothetical protein [Sandaracinaceae bacterium LLY-WYZ-13_1]
MNSSPPGARDSAPPALARLASDEACALAEGVVFFCVEGAPPQLCRTRTGPDGSLTFRTELTGRVCAARRDELHLEVGPHHVVVRHLLPEAIRLDELVGRRISLVLRQRYGGRGRATIDAELRDEARRLLLWAHDGRLPADREAHGLALRTSFDAANGHRLALAHDGGVAHVAPSGRARIRMQGHPHDAALIRLGVDDVSLVVLRAS